MGRCATGWANASSPGPAGSHFSRPAPLTLHDTGHTPDPRSKDMKAIVIQEHGGPEKLVLRDLPDPEPKAGHVVIQVKAFGVNHAETHMRQGQWPEWTPVSGIECAGLVKSDPDGHLPPGQKVVALMGGMGRTINGSYAEYTRVPASNVVPIQTS